MICHKEISRDERLFPYGRGSYTDYELGGRHGTKLELVCNRNDMMSMFDFIENCHPDTFLWERPFGSCANCSVLYYQ
ncbi:hypothetical protein AArcS_0012 [Natranaeroarchaeum sulfidigenes]|uniref:Uncharacterized protein n=1 Tax=Natranaeroarchaeum sulfidigenes TaxID=2784880 RepID=A0A897MSQ6_9EURY|nr:hypothetical protein AArcS_0012 [Natranaeroarchaeum sulfidigenes]